MASSRHGAFFLAFLLPVYTVSAMCYRERDFLGIDRGTREIIEVYLALHIRQSQIMERPEFNDLLRKSL